MASRTPGNSTLLSRISRARPRIAAYPFTTLTPNLGVVELPDYRSFVVADIPGLIEGAHDGRGLGHQFLRHIERTRALAILLPVDGEDPAATLAGLRRELEEYSPTLTELPWAVVFSKMDLHARGEAKPVVDASDAWDRYYVSAVTGDGLRELLEGCLAPAAGRANDRGGGRHPMTEARQMIDALTLRGLPGVGPMRFRAMVDHFGSPAAAVDASAAEIAAVPEVSAGTPARSLARTLELGAKGTAARSDAVRKAREVHERCASAGIAVMVYGTAGYPAMLRHLKDPPPVLFALGRTRLLQRRCAAIVGSRRATAYGRRVARSLGASWAAQRRCVVSGMAMGIDAEAHRGALPGPTAAVLGSWVDVVSPPRNRTLYGKIVECGVVVSEFAPGVRAEPHHFPRRNRIIAALGARCDHRRGVAKERRADHR